MKTSGKRRACTAAGIVLAAVLLGTCGFFASHFADTVRVDDTRALLAYVQERRSRLRSGDGSGRADVPPEILAQDRMGAYYAALLSAEDPGHTELWLFQKDPALRGHYRWMGDRSVEAGLGLFGQPDDSAGETVLAVAGYNPLGVIQSYRFFTGDRSYVEDTAAAGYQVKLYLVPGALESSTMYFYGESGEELTEGDIRQALLQETNEQYKQGMEIPYVN